ncbi:MAG TPA: electron transfer flavoprotein subunit beta/FixA family protein [Phycisphaerae bacterium]
MRIATVIKQVPDSNASIRVLADGSGIETAGLKMVCDPFDEFGVELAVQLREKRSDVEEIVAFTVGPEKASEIIRTALAMGADRGVHVCDPAFASRNEIFLAEVLAAAIRKEGKSFDLILCGKQNIDLDSGELGPALGEFLDLPHVGATTFLEVAADGKSFKARRRIEGAEEAVECGTPALLTIEKGLVEPRYPSLPNLMKAKKKPVAVLTAKDLPGLDGASVGTALLSLTPPPPRPPCKFVEGEPEQMARELVRLLREEAKVV